MDLQAAQPRLAPEVVQQLWAAGASFELAVGPLNIFQAKKSNVLQLPLCFADSSIHFISTCPAPLSPFALLLLSDSNAEASQEEQAIWEAFICHAASGLSIQRYSQGLSVE